MAKNPQHTSPTEPERAPYEAPLAEEVDTTLTPAETSSGISQAQ